MPNAVVGYNPVFDTTDKGYGSKKVVGRETEISPCHQVKKNMSPMLLFHGKADKTVPFENSARFTKLIKIYMKNDKLLDGLLIIIAGASFVIPFVFNYNIDLKIISLAIGISILSRLFLTNRKLRLLILMFCLSGLLYVMLK